MKILTVLLLGVFCGCAIPRTPTPTKAPPLPSTKAVVAPKSQPKKLGGPSVTLAWDASPSPEVAGYNVYQGGASRAYTNVLDAGPTLTCTFTNFARGTTLYYAATAYSTNGLESDFSEEISYTSADVPKPPTNLRVTAEIAFNPAGPWVEFTNWLAPVSLTNSFFRLVAVPE